MKTWWHSDRSQWKKQWKKTDKFEHVVLSLIKVAIARTKKPDSNKIHSVVCKRWCSGDWKKRAIIPPLSPCKCQIIENDEILTFCNLSPQLTKKAILKLNDANLSPQKKTEQNSWQNKRQASSVSLLNLPYMKPNYPQAPQIPPRPPNPITLWTKNKHRILLFIYEKEIRIVKLNEMCVEETKSQNKKETLSWF